MWGNEDDKQRCEKMPIRLYIVDCYTCIKRQTLLCCSTYISVSSAFSIAKAHCSGVSAPLSATDSMNPQGISRLRGFKYASSGGTGMIAPKFSKTALSSPQRKQGPLSSSESLKTSWATAVMGAKARNTTMKSVKQFILGGTSSIVNLFSFFSTPTKCSEMKEERGEEKSGWRRRKSRSAGRADVHSRRNQSRFDNQFPTKTTTKFCMLDQTVQDSAVLNARRNYVKL